MSFPTPGAPAINLLEFAFTEKATAGVYTATYKVPAGTDVVGWQATQIGPVWAADSAFFYMGDTLSGPLSYTGGNDLTVYPTYTPIPPNGSGHPFINAENPVHPYPTVTLGAIVGVDDVAQTIELAGDLTRYFKAATLPTGAQGFLINGSTGNDGTYTNAVDATFAAGKTTITTNEALPDPTVDGNVQLSAQSFEGSSPLAPYSNDNTAFYLWNGYGNAVQYHTGGTITMTVTTAIASPPVVPVGIMRVRLAVVPPVTAVNASFA